MERVSVGIVGAGYIGREHARCLRLIRPLFGGKLEVCGIADKDLQAAKAAARDFEIGYATDDVDKLISDPNINVVFSCVPTKFHLQIFKKVIQAGKAIFLEKPFAQTSKDAVEMNKLLLGHPVPCQVGFVLRYAPVYHVLKSVLKDKADESSLMTVILRDDQAMPIGGRMHFTPWRADPALTAGGVLVEHGIHDIDILEWFFGPIISVRSRSKNFAGHPKVEDYMSVEFSFENGVEGTMIHLWHGIESHQSIRHFEIFFQKAFITLDSYGMDGMLVRDEEADHVWNREDLYRKLKDIKFFPELMGHDDIVLAGDYYAIQDYAFVRNLLDGKSLSPNLGDGIRAYGVVQACYASAAAGGKKINVNEFIKQHFS